MMDAIQEVVKAVRKAEHIVFSRSEWSLSVILDLQNAFNSAKWRDMVRSLEHTFEIPK